MTRPVRPVRRRLRSVRGPEHSERVYPFRAPEREALAGLPAGARILDLGCSDGANLARLRSGGWVCGLDTSMQRLRTACHLAPVVAGTGEHLPFADAAFDLVYVSHVLHHANHRGVLAEVARATRPDGLLFVIETVEDNPGIRLARRIHSRWDSDAVHSRFHFEELRADVERAGFDVIRGQLFNVVYWMWDVAQVRVPVLRAMIGVAERAEMLAARRWSPRGAHAFLVARRRPS